VLERLDFENMKSGIGIFLSNDIEKVLYLPFTPVEHAIVDRSFQLRDLVFTNNRTIKYWVLCLSESPTRLLEGFGPENLTEIKDENFSC
jgi:hypothetical protein